jgi:hypothetical protein
VSAQPDFDNLRRRADIRRALVMNPDRDEFIVEALYDHFVAIYKRQPVDDEFPEYVYLVSSTHEWGELSELFSSHSPLSAEEKEARLRRAAPWSTVDRPPRPETMPASRVRRPGRPGWTPELFWSRYRDAYGRSEPPHSYRLVALHFVTLDGHRGTDAEYLRKLVRRFGLPAER